MRIILLFFLFISCTSLDKEYDVHLRNGLETYSQTREVNLNFVPGLSMKKIAFLNKSNGAKIMVIRLNDDALKLQMEKYCLSIKTYLDRTQYKEILNGKEYVSTSVKPSLISINGYKYIEVPYELDVDRVDKIEFFLFDRDKFRKVLSKPITISNLGL